MKKAALCILTLLSLAAAPVQADPAAPRDIFVREVVDGDTFWAENGDSIRLWGVSAAERGDIRYWGAGHFLADMAQGRTVSCVQKDIDHYGRFVMQCAIGGADLGAAIIAAGWAKDYTKFSGGYYKPQEEAARAAKIGIWADLYESQPFYKRF